MTLTEIHKRLRPAFPSKWDAETDGLAKAELKSMIAQFGESRTDRAVTEFIRNEQFFSIARLREYIPPSTAGGKLYEPGCLSCDEGWQELAFENMHPNDKNKLIRVYGIHEAHNHTVRQRCALCWKGVGLAKQTA